MLSERLKTAMRDADVSQAELARACKVKPPSVHGWLSGKAKFLRGENLLKVAEVLGVNQQWLATGNGPIRNTATASITAPMPTLQASGGPTVLSPMANALGQLFDMLPQDAVTRTRAYNRATEAILRVLQGFEDQPTHTPAPSDPAQTPPARRLTDAHS